MGEVLCWGEWSQAISATEGSKFKITLFTAVVPIFVYFARVLCTSLLLQYSPYDEFLPKACLLSVAFSRRMNGGLLQQK